MKKIGLLALLLALILWIINYVWGGEVTVEASDE